MITAIFVKPGAQIVRSGLQDLQNEVPKIGRRQIYEVTRRALQRLKNVPPPSYPLNWDSEKQRKAFFASGGFGKGIPHQRGDIEKKFTISSTPKGYSIKSSYPGMKFIVGDEAGRSQSGIHAGRWPVFRQVVEEEFAKLPDEVKKEMVIMKRKTRL